MTLPAGANIVVNLDPWEILQAAFAGLLRQALARTNGLQDRYGFEGERWSTDVHAAGGELAASKVTGRCWLSSPNQFKGADLFPNIEVRTRSGVGPRRDLIVHREDLDDRIFVLVIGQMPTYTVVGWITAPSAKREEFWKDPAGGRPAFFVPEYEMIPFPIRSDVRITAKL